MESQGAQRHSQIYYGYVVVAAATVILVAALGVHYAFGVFFKPLSAELGWTRAMTSGAVSLSWIVQGIACTFMGALNDKYGPRVVLTLCGFIMGLGYLLTSQVNSLWQLYVCYGLIAGTGLGGVYVPLISTVARWFTARRSAMTGIVVAGIGIGTLLTPPAATWLITSYSWRVSYMVLGIMALLVVVLFAQLLRKPAAQKAPANPDAASKRSSFIEQTFAGLTFNEAVRTRQFWMVFVVFLCFASCLYTILVHIVPFATDLKIEPAAAAGVLSAIGGVSIVGKVMFGRIGDNIGGRNTYIISLTIMIVSLLGLLLVREVWVIYLFAFVFAFAYASGSVGQSPLVALLFGLRAHGVILGGVNFGYTIGAAIGPIMAGYIFDLSGSYLWAFSILAVLAVVGLLFTLAIKPVGKFTSHRQ